MRWKKEVVKGGRGTWWKEGRKKEKRGGNGKWEMGTVNREVGCGNVDGCGCNEVVVCIVDDR